MRSALIFLAGALSGVLGLLLWQSYQFRSFTMIADSSSPLLGELGRHKAGMVKSIRAGGVTSITIRKKSCSFCPLVQRSSPC